MRYSEFFKEIEDFGWEWVDTKKHRRYKHPNFKQPLIVPNHPGKEIPKGTLNALRKQAGLK